MFLDDLVVDVPSGDVIELSFGYHLDWELLELAIQDANAMSWAVTRHRFRPVNIYELTGHGPGKRAADAYFKTQAHALLSRHHALCDARALRLAYEAACAPLTSETTT